MSLTFSNSHMWASCSASKSPSPAEFGGIAGPVSEERQEGTAFAWVCAGLIRGDATSSADYAGEIAPNGWPIDEAMARHAGDYHAIVTRHGAALAEQDCTLWGGLVNGRPDAYATEASDVLHVYEAKYGRRIHEPYGNTQLLLAAIALRRPHHRLFSLEIFQPRPFHPGGAHRKSVIDAVELQTWHDHLYNAARATLDKHPAAVPGLHCDFCDRRGVCSGLANNIYAQYEIFADTRRAGRMSGVEIGAELKFLKMAEKLIKARLTGVEAEAEGRTKRGDFVQDWYLEPETGNRVWTAPSALIGALTGCDPFHKPKQKSPAELEKEGANPETVKKLTVAPYIGHKLRPHNPQKIAKIFGDK